MADTLTGRRKRGPSPEKAKKMLRDNSAQGRPLSPAQKGFFGLIAGGGTPTKTAKKRRKGYGKR